MKTLPTQIPTLCCRTILTGLLGGLVWVSGPLSWAAPPGPPAFGTVGSNASTGVAGPGMPGYHDPRSAVPPLSEKAGVLSWRLFGQVRPKIEKNRVVPQFPAELQAFNNARVKVQGFVMPLDPGTTQKHFLLSSVPTSCAFCIPAGPEGLIEVHSKTAIKVGIEGIVLEGRLQLLSTDPTGLYYRLSDAAVAP
ncbi:MAG: hypothetical protein AB3X41_01415 [Leptothrix ochracea]|uniref:hypothetical protein n=1 Tax=Leptothrix ochracea TaxID=735331 RepID=UPI0034E24785